MKHNYINDDIVIDFDVPMVLKNLMLDAEKADLEEDEGTYLNYADTIDVWAKNYYQDGELSNLQWELLCRRYPQ
ncbi:MAG: hypothetical protein IJR29_11350 [Butyrivibrio sp.]|nr:hypothetical protein [Butyrivibrio sp.]